MVVMKQWHKTSRFWNKGFWRERISVLERDERKKRENQILEHDFLPFFLIYLIL